MFGTDSVFIYQFSLQTNFTFFKVMIFAGGQSVEEKMIVVCY